MVEERLRLGWRMGAWGCLLPMLAVGTAVFGVAALSAEHAAQMADGRGGHLIRMSAAVSAGGVNLPLAAFALYMAFVTFRFAWRWADEDAVWADSEGLHFHGSLFRRSVGWGDLKSVTAQPRRRGRGQFIFLTVETRDGRTVEVADVDVAGGARFAAAVRERLSR